MRRVGLYGGMFDPIHVGHLALALALIDGLDEVWFCPAACSPHKSGKESTPARHRLQMCELAVEEIPRLSVKGLEIDRPPPSYTIETVRQLRSLHPDVELRLLLGSDALARLEEWAEVEELLELAPPLIGRREFKVEIPQFKSKRLRELCESGVVETPLLEVSSSDLRPRLRRGEYCGHLIPAPSYQYLIENELYT